MHSMAYSSQFPSPSSSSRSLSLSPAHSIKSTSKHHHHQHSRRPSPLKRQMSLGLGDPTSSSAALNIDPNRDHAAGPLAVLYSVKPDEDPLLAGGASPVKASPSTNNTILRGGALQHSPSSNNTSANVEIPPDTPRSVSALANLERTAVTAPLPSSPNRSLLAAFQAVSPRTQAVTAKSTSLPSLSNLGAAPRGVQPFQHSSLAPASPIYSSPKQSTRRNTYATAAFRALNGASPQKQVSASRNSRTEQSSNSASLPGTANVSPISSRSGSISRQAQSEVPTWTVYRDAEAPPSGASSSSSVVITQSGTTQDGAKSEGVSTLDDDGVDTENDENSNMALHFSDAAGTAANMSSSFPGIVSTQTPPANHRGGSLSTSSLPPPAATGRDVTPPPSADRWREATQGTYPRQSGPSTAPISSSAQRARKRLRTSGELST